MAKNLLIDTCVWLELVAQTEFSGYLKQLSNWSDSEEIILYCPVALKEEWKKHRLLKLAQFEKILSNHIKTLKTAKLFNKIPDFDELEINYADKVLTSQILEIDKLLDRAIQLEESTFELELTNTHKRQGKAPFHVKTDSYNDAMLIFSTLEGLKKTDQNELFFFSNNSNDFGDPSNPKQIIHKDISNQYPEIRIHYFAKLSDGIKQLNHMGLPSSKASNNPLSVVKKLISVNRKEHIVDQIYNYLDQRFKDIRFLPQKLFCRHYPFILEQNYSFHHIPFTAETDNPELLNWFASLNSIDGRYIPNSENFGVEDYENKVKDILQSLRGNLIQKIALNYNGSVDIPYIDNNYYECNCLLCLYKRFNYSEMIKSLDKSDVNEPTLKQAFVHYVIGQYKEAISVLKVISDNARETKLYVTYFIAQYNLSILGKLIEYDNNSTPEEFALIEEANHIDLDNVFIFAEQPANRDILQWIKKGRFYHDTEKIIQRLVNEIRNDFYNGNSGWSNYTRELLNEYNELDGFVQHNYIMYHKFSEYRSITKMFIEGLFASYACKKALSGKLIQFSDLIIEKIVMHGHSSDIKAMHSRYKLSILKYSPSNISRSFVQLFINLLVDYPKTVEAYQNFESEGRIEFWNTYHRMFYNNLTMAALLDLEKQDFDAILSHLLLFLRTQKHLNEFELTKALKYYLNKKINVFSEEQLEEVLLFVIASDSINKAALIGFLGQALENRKLKIQFDNPTWITIQNTFLTHDFLRKDPDSIDSIAHLYQLLSNSKKRMEISQVVKHYLKLNFDVNVFYTASMYDIIGSNKKLFKEYTDRIVNSIHNDNRIKLFNHKEYYNNVWVDEFINYTFKFNIQLEPNLKHDISQLGDYYVWLLNIDGFNYNNFDPEWMFNYFTRYYKDEFRKSGNLKNYLSKLSKKTEDIQLLRLYFDIYV